jgi:hypothetical protein
LAEIEWERIRRSNATQILAQVSLYEEKEAKRSRLIREGEYEVRSRGDVLESTGDAAPG